MNFFGENRFDVMTYYQNDSEQLPECVINRRYPYQVDVSAYLEVKEEPTLFITSTFEKWSESERIQLARLCDKIRGGNVILIHSSEVSEPDCTSAVKLSRESIEDLSNCAFIMPMGMNMVLLDSKHGIRGYYQLSDGSDIDRAVVELDILVMNKE